MASELASTAAPPRERTGEPARTAPRGGWRERAVRTLTESPALAPALLAVGVFLWFAADEAGFEGTTFLPAILLLAALLITALAALPRPRPSRLALVAVLLLAAYAAFSYLSIVWADDRGIAWDGANRTLLYALVLALFALWPMRAPAAALVVGAFGLGVAVVGGVELLRANAASSSIAHLHEGRLSEPAGYANANVALWFTAFWPSVVLAGRREVHPLLRGAFLGASGLLAGLAILGQSRGWLFALPIVAALAIVVVPGRGRTIAALVAVAAGVLLALGPLLDVFEAFDPQGPPGAAFADAVRSLLIVSAGLAVAGFAAALADRRVRVPRARARFVSAALVAAVALAGAGAVGAYAVAERSPMTALADKWSEFKQGGTEPDFEGSRLTTAAATYRYDYWRVAWEEFRRAPLVGVGADNFGADYLRLGRSNQTPAYPHSVQLRALSQTGLIGALLLLGSAVAAFAAAAPALRRHGLAGAAAGAGVLVFGYWAVHGSLDWFWEFPGLAAPAFAFLGLAAAVAARRPARRTAPLLRTRRGAAIAAAAGLVLAAGVVPPWLAERDLREARRLAAEDPGAALDRLDRSSRLNPLSPRAHQTAGAIEIRLGDLEAARRHFRLALRRHADSSLAYLELGAIASTAGHRPYAEALLEAAHRLAPRDGPTRRALRSVRAGERLDPARVNADIRRDIRARIGPD